MHRDDAERLHIQEGTTVRLVSGRGEAILPAVVSRPDDIVYPLSFSVHERQCALVVERRREIEVSRYKVSAVAGGEIQCFCESMTDDLSGAHWKLIT
jgi:predicted molibdopterin-dependent oxidoreductase YjgC